MISAGVGRVKPGRSSRAQSMEPCSFTSLKFRSEIYAFRFWKLQPPQISHVLLEHRVVIESDKTNLFVMGVAPFLDRIQKIRVIGNALMLFAPFMLAIPDHVVKVVSDGRELTTPCGIGFSLLFKPGKDLFDFDLAPE